MIHFVIIHQRSFLQYLHHFSVSDYSERKVAKVLNVELADTLGNLLSRVTGAALNPHQQFPPFHEEYFPRNDPRGATSGVSKEDYNLLDALQNLPGENDIVLCIVTVLFR